MTDEQVLWKRLGDVVAKAHKYVNRGERVPQTLRDQYLDLTRELMQRMGVPDSEMPSSISESQSDGQTVQFGVNRGKG